MKNLIRKIKIKFLSRLVFLANSCSQSHAFYRIKNDLLDRFGEEVGYDVQIVGGKKCFACNGSGVYVGYYWSSGEQWSDTCNRCWDGWYKLPTWNVLLKRRFGKYVFHTPLKRFYSKKECAEYISNERFFRPPDDHIEGYVFHKYQKHGEFALQVLYLVYDRQAWRGELHGFGMGWACNWRRPSNIINNIFHLARYRSRAIPFHRFEAWLEKRRESKNANLSIFEGEIYDFDDYPF